MIRKQHTPADNGIRQAREILYAPDGSGFIIFPAAGKPFYLPFAVMPVEEKRIVLTHADDPFGVRPSFWMTVIALD